MVVDIVGPLAGSMPVPEVVHIQGPEGECTQVPGAECMPALVEVCTLVPVGVYTLDPAAGCTRASEAVFMQALVVGYTLVSVVGCMLVLATAI